MRTTNGALRLGGDIGALSDARAAHMQANSSAKKKDKKIAEYRQRGLYVLAVVYVIDIVLWVLFSRATLTIRGVLGAYAWYSAINYLCYMMIVSGIKNAHGTGSTDGTWQDLAMTNMAVQLLSHYFVTWAKWLYIWIPVYFAVRYMGVSSGGSAPQMDAAPTSSRAAAGRAGSSKRNKQKRRGGRR